MKIRRSLSDIDLANLLTLEPGPILDQALKVYNAGGGSWSYNPVRQSTSDILGAAVPLFGSLEPLSWLMIEQQISSACNRGVIQTTSNLEVAKRLYDCARSQRWSAAKLPMGRLPIGFHDTVCYWSDVVLDDGEGLFIPFFDHRRTKGIANASSRQIVFSMQHLWVRERNPDLASARLAVIRFPSRKNGRGIKLDFHDEADLLSYDELDRRVRIVYESWARVSAEKAYTARGTGTHGTPMGF